MSLSVGTQLGSLEIMALLGKGGMGEIYRARDTKLKREWLSRSCPRSSRGMPIVLAGFNARRKFSRH